MQNRFDLMTSQLPMDGWSDGKSASMSASKQLQVNTDSQSLLRLLLLNIYDSFLSWNKSLPETFILFPSSWLITLPVTSNEQMLLSQALKNQKKVLANLPVFSCGRCPTRQSFFMMATANWFSMFFSLIIAFNFLPCTGVQGMVTAVSTSFDNSFFPLFML